MTSQHKWDMRFLNLARTISSWSKDPSTQVGAVLVNDKRIVIGTGYNGFARGDVDDDALYSDRDYKYKHIIHAEVNACINATQSCEGATAYTYPFMPCIACGTQLAQYGIRRVVSLHNDNPRWTDSFTLTKDLFKRCNIEWILYKDIISC